MIVIYLFNVKAERCELNAKDPGVECQNIFASEGTLFKSTSKQFRGFITLV